MDTSEWKKQLKRQRKEKDLFFGTHPQSPIPGPEQRDFRGLSYFPPDPGYRFVLDLHESREKDTIEIGDTAGQTRRLWRWGELRFRIDGRDCALQAYKADPDEGHLFVPFRDKTSGDETYPAGRYMDLEPALHRTAEGKWVVDFNEAYNPWCAYSKDYACPFVPPENRLDVPVRAGEKRYQDDIE